MKRRYRQTRRAEASAETRRRIVDATIQLHTTVGPAKTTISAIAEQAGVERLTVYRHFPSEEDLFRACVTHGWELFPPPDYGAWARIADPEQRLRTALTELYAYYGSVGDAFVVVVRDFPRVPALAALNVPYFAKWDEMRDVLARGWKRRGNRRQSLLGAIAHSLDLSTWESFIRRHAVSDAQAVELLVGLVRCA
jgi:AcrR family transcriptional regulator